MCGAGREVVRRMGLEQAVRRENTGERGIVFTDATGRRRAAGPDGRRVLLRERFADAGGLAPRVLAALDTTDELYAEDVGQVRMDTWSRGRTVLLGDAACCPSPITGMGTSLALVGAYVLAGELAARPGDPAAAFAAYEVRMRPFADRAQRLPPGGPRLANPCTRTGIRLLHAAVRTATRPPLTALAARLASPPADAITLPRYDGDPTGR
ncbi:FAD-dependent monooxygenase [Streptomyces solincola]|uniref:FAD-dependent monooxygenase n=1 Tax=Streptomyces solincola TaxID=2100817 RepID=UPI002158B5B6|nr:FAD-dependent monooxygenase [Streptomyces solincola]